MASVEPAAAQGPEPEPEPSVARTDTISEIESARTLFDVPEELTNLGPGAAGPDILKKCAAAMAASAQSVLSAPDAHTLMQYGPCRGDGRYIRELSIFLTSEYGCTPDEPVLPERLCLTSGATSGCAMVCSLFFKPGDTVFIEDPACAPP